jgi:transcriptional regulator with XRE-family HTH domain
MAHIGELLRVIRLEWGLTLREVMERSQIIAKIWGSPSHAVSYGHLAKVEKGEHDLTVDKFLSLSEIELVESHCMSTRSDWMSTRN